MKLPVVNELYELIEAEGLLIECLRPWEVQFQRYDKELSQVLHWKTLPMATVAINRHLEAEPRVGSHLAAIFPLILISDHIHAQVTDDYNKTDGDDSFPYSILLGDYLFGKAVGMLTRIDGHRLLPYFSDLICLVNEGHVMGKLSGNKVDFETLAREKASYYQYSFLTAAVFSGKGPYECAFYEKIGYHLGMALTLFDKGFSKASFTHIGQMNNLWSDNFCRSNRSSDVLRDLLDVFAQELNSSQKVAAI